MRNLIEAANAVVGREEFRRRETDIVQLGQPRLDAKAIQRDEQGGDVAPLSIDGVVVPATELAAYRDLLFAVMLRTPARPEALDAFVACVLESLTEYDQRPQTHVWVHIMRNLPSSARREVLTSLALPTAPRKPVQAAIKRGLDVVVAGTLIVVLSPVLALIAVMIFADDRTPILFRSPRLGRGGERFSCLKFRSMRISHDDALDHRDYVLSLLDNEAQASATPLFKISSDPRITRVGRFLRFYSIDEFPQLFNIVSGDMSLVGPRPVISWELDRYPEWESARHQVRPGMLGAWQLSSDYSLSFDDMLRIDTTYVANWSLWRDAKILARTVPAVLTRRRRR